MYDTARRVALVKQRVRENTRRRQRRGIYGLSAMCMLLFAVLMQAVGTVAGPGQPEAWGVFGAMLLREDAGGYVLVAVVSFAAAAAITAPSTIGALQTTTLLWRSPSSISTAISLLVSAPPRSTRPAWVTVMPVP